MAWVEVGALEAARPSADAGTGPDPSRERRLRPLGQTEAEPGECSQEGATASLRKGVASGGRRG